MELAPNYPELYATCLEFSANHPACEELFLHLRPIFQRVAFRVARQFGALQETDDILQEIKLKLVHGADSILPSLPQESTAAAAYFSVVAANTARDYFRARGSAKRGASATVSLQDSLEWVAVDTRAMTDIELDLLLDQIEGHLEGDPRERSIFRLYYRQGYKAREIAAIPALQLTTKGVESMLHRICNQVRQKVAMGTNPETEGKPVKKSFH